jgi:cytidine deaminase
LSELSEEELAFIERVKPILEDYLEFLREQNLEPGAGSYVLSTTGRIYHGVPFIGARGIHGEENAIGSMITEEGLNARLETILVVGAPDEIIMPCGICRKTIWRFGVEGATVICTNQSLTKIRKFIISELYPYPNE